jgi:eukaryotic-like serine/threonine-protein kinase
MSDSQPNGAESAELNVLRRVVALCEEFEVEWRAGCAPRIDAFLERVEPEMRDGLLRELLAIEVELRAARGENPTPDQLRGLYPGWDQAIAAAFASGRSRLRANGGAFESGFVHTSGTPPRTEVETGGFINPAELTVAASGSHGTKSVSSEDEPVPDRLGRYQVSKRLGKGGFGTVYLARDDELSRLVAVKVPHTQLLRSPKQVEAFLAEARIAAGLRHPAIVTAHDVGRSGENEVFVVYEYVAGRNLAEVFENERLSPSQIARLLVPIAEAANYAHHAGLVHRDLKPSNILIDEDNKPHITDFGLAIREDLQDLRTGEIAGTAHYMSPEQVRGETHRLDGRTDVWALGVILYRSLVGRQPFSGRHHTEIFDEILNRDPKPPRQINDRIPRELERICLKCLSKRMADRYETAGDLADDLKRWLVAEVSTDTFSNTPQPTPAPGAPSVAARIVPKGLRAFDMEDAEFFLTLLPGARDREGLPESIAGWKRRVEERDASRTFAVGLLYGPSGSGKSSLIKAGLIPRLSRTVRAIYVEATPGGTEAALRAAFGREFPDLVRFQGLEEAAAAIRGRMAGQRGPKVLVVIDQFEQWLQSHPDESDGELIRTLRQCDGLGFQALLLVRDDFWMAITRFLRALEVRLVEGVNSAPVELFDLQHASRVLAELGHALGRLPDPPIAPASPPGRFLELAVHELAGPGGRVIPVRLTLFAEMLRYRDWSSRTLRELGGMEGIGVMFLEETFAARTAPPVHRYYQRAAQAVLRALLPDPGSDLKGRMRPLEMLKDASGCGDRREEFAELMYILDNELRMVTPADPSSAAEEGCGTPGRQGEACYQLTHDYLIGPLRQWLNRKQAETRRGRAELRLAKITALWRDLPESRRLPSLSEWAKIACFTRYRSWTTDERRLMRAATRQIVLRAAALLISVALAGYAAVSIRNRDRANAALDNALHADYARLPLVLPQIAANIGLLRPRLERLANDLEAPLHDREVATVALFDDQPNAARSAFLADRLVSAQPDEVWVIGQALAAHPEHAGADLLQKRLFDERAEPVARLRVACALAAIEPDSVARWEGIPAILAEALLAEHRRALPRWIELLGPAAPLLAEPLSAICRDRDHSRDATAHSTAADALAYVLHQGGDPVKLAQATVDSVPEASRVLLYELVSLDPTPEVAAYLNGVLAEQIDDHTDETAKDALANRQAAAAIALVAMAEPDSAWPLLKHRADPRVRSVLIQRLAANPLTTRALLDRFARPKVDSTELQALLLAWAEMRQGAVAAPVREAVLKRAQALYCDDPDPGVHSGAELLLQRWEGTDRIAKLETELRRRKTRKDGQRWLLGPNQHTFAILPGPLEFRMGSLPHEPAHYGDPNSHFRKIERSIMVATKEVTLSQFQKYKPGHQNEARYGDEPECVAHNLSWFSAAGYCNFLSKIDGIDESEWCYPDEPAPGMEIPEDNAERTGYRLPTEAEWEYFCRAGTDTARHYGDSTELLPRYAWTWLNSDNRAMAPGLLLPNEFGLFDVFGNAWEWCQDGPQGFYDKSVTRFPLYPDGTREQPAGDPVRRETIEFIDRARETWRILRGGAFNYAPNRARSAYRDWQPSSDEREYLGIRVVRTLPPELRAQVRGTVEGAK